MFYSFQMIWRFSLLSVLPFGLKSSKGRTGFQKWISMFDEIWNFHSKHISRFCLCSPVVLGKSCLKVLKEPETLFICQSSAAPDLIIFSTLKLSLTIPSSRKSIRNLKKKSSHLHHLFSSKTIFVSRLRPWLMQTSKKVFRLTIKAMIGRAQTGVWNSW